MRHQRGQMYGVTVRQDGGLTLLLFGRLAHDVNLFGSQTNVRVHRNVFGAAVSCVDDYTVILEKKQKFVITRVRILNKSTKIVKKSA